VLDDIRSTFTWVLSPCTTGKGIPVELITESGEDYATATPAAEDELLLADSRHKSFNVELPSVSTSASLTSFPATNYGAGSSDTQVDEFFTLLGSGQGDAHVHTDSHVSQAHILPAVLRCGIRERSCAIAVLVISCVIAVLTLAMQATNPTSTAGG
jgi:hypothetical protein